MSLWTLTLYQELNYVKKENEAKLLTGETWHVRQKNNLNCHLLSDCKENGIRDGLMQQIRSGFLWIRGSRIANVMKWQGGFSSYQSLTFPFLAPEQYAKPPVRNIQPAFKSFAHRRKAPYFQWLRVWKEGTLKKAFYSTDEECYKLLATL
jgi:hypothetical protein